MVSSPDEDRNGPSWPGGGGVKEQLANGRGGGEAFSVKNAGGIGGAWWLDNKHVIRTLHRLTKQEQVHWRPREYPHFESNPGGGEITGRLRDQHVRWMDSIKENLCLGPDTFFLAVTTLDRFLGSVQARPRYLRCITVTCLFLAAKMCEEDEHVPSTRELIDASMAGFTAGDVLRMERIILDKLGWSLMDSPTALHFLEALHPLVLDIHPALLAPYARSLGPGQHLQLVAGRVRRALYDHRIARYPPSLLAVEALRLELEVCCSQFAQDIMDSMTKILEWEPRLGQFDLASLLSSLLYLELKMDARVVYGLGTALGGGGAKKRRRQRTESKCNEEGRPKTKKKFQEDESEVEDAYLCIRNLFPSDSPPPFPRLLSSVPGTPLLSCGLQSSPSLLSCLRHALIFGLEDFPFLPAGAGSPAHQHTADKEEEEPQRTYAEVLRTHLPRVAALTV